MDHKERVIYLMRGATLQDSLLQSYRSFHLTMQSIFVAIGTGLAISVLRFDDILRSNITASVLFLFAFLSYYLQRKLKIMILHRGQDVTWWHKELIQAEVHLESDCRYFTKFKIEQCMRREGNEHLLKLLDLKDISGAQIDDIVGKGLGHTRRILDVWLYRAMTFIWFLIISISIGSILMGYGVFSG